MSSAKPVVLVIDDDPVLTKLYRAKLRREGFSAVVAKDGGKGFEKAKTERPDAIILDLMMPGIDGMHILQMLRRQKETKQVPILVLTNKDDLRKEAMTIGADDYFVKANTTPKKVVDRIVELIPGARERLAPSSETEPEEKPASQRKAVKISTEKVIIPVPRSSARAAIEAPAAEAPVASPEDKSEAAILARTLATLAEHRPKNQVEVGASAPGHIFGPGEQYEFLLVEDDPIIARLYQAKFEFENQTVTHAMNGQMALDYLDHNRPSLILLDIRMPDMSGLDVLKTIKIRGIMVPVVMLTNLDDPATIKKAQELGAKDYLIKSQTTPREVLTRVRQILKAAPPPA